MEEYLLDPQNQRGLAPTVLRFAIAYGLSPRMRFDLTVNEFTREVALGKELLTYFSAIRALGTSTKLRSCAASIASQRALPSSLSILLRVQARHVRTSSRGAIVGMSSWQR